MSLTDERNLPDEMADETEITEEEREAIRREFFLARPEHTAPDQYPRMFNISPAFIYNAVARAEVPVPSEYVTIPLPVESRVELKLAVSEWNIVWEAAQFRRRMFDYEELPAPLARIAERGDFNIVFIPRTASRYYEYAPLFHLLPKATVERHGLPLISAGQWPFFFGDGDIDGYLPSDFEARLARAWAATIWRRLMPVSRLTGFSKSDPIRVLAHNLDYWIPPVNEVVVSVLRELPTVDKGTVEGPVPLEDGSYLEGVTMANPRIGTDLWRGEEDAAEIVEWVVDQADADGRLRSVLDAVRSNRVEDDFSDHWSFAREDFERKLYKKRSKVRVRFVELTDSAVVRSPETDVVDRMMYGDFLTLLDERERQVVVLLHSGVTKLTEIGDLLGYANHSPVSKRLAAIRRKAERFFDEN